jgi:hypothetical protein
MHEKHSQHVFGAEHLARPEFAYCGMLGDNANTIKLL